MKDRRTEARDSEQAAASSSTSRQELRGYEQLKFKVAEVIREIMAVARERRDQNLERQARELQVRLAEDRFNLAVIGQFSRGKSTLMNALLGMDCLPTGIVPVTSVITSVSYGTRERVLLHFPNSNLSSEVPLEELARYVTEQGNPGNKMKIEVAEVQLPAELLQRGFYFVDTPGLGSAIFANTETTRKFFPQCDAVIFVTTFESPLTSEELASFEEVARYVRKVFLIINKMDLVSPEQLAEVMKFVCQQVAKMQDAPDVEIFPVSARAALQGKLGHGEERVDQTGLPDFERALTDFLTVRKAEDFLLIMCDRTGALLDIVPDEMRASLAARLNQIRAQASQRKVTGVDRGSGGTSSQFSPFEALRPCPICERVLNASFDFLSQYQYELCTKADVQRSHAEGNGFCSWHTWQYERIASPQGICSGYPKTIEKLAERCKKIANDLGTGVGDSVPERVIRRVRCPVCDVASEAQNEGLQLALAEIEDAQTSGSSRSHNFCLPHLDALAKKVQNKGAFAKLLLHEAGVFEQLSENMRRFALKHEGLSMHLAKEEERKAPRQALSLLVGHPNSRIEEENDSRCSGASTTRLG
jgi:GTP-binding protein EngB required for normal cell division